LVGAPTGIIFEKDKLFEKKLDHDVPILFVGGMSARRHY